MKARWLSSGQLPGPDNEFIQEAGLGSARPPRSQSVDPAIQALEVKNEKLQEEVAKVEKVLKGLSETKTTYGIKLPQINPEVLQKELVNAYKMIKSYEYEISKRQQTESEIVQIENIRRLEKMLQQRASVKERLRKEIAEVKRTSMELTKDLQGSATRQQYESKSIQLNGEIKYLQDRLREAEAKKQINIGNLEKQRKHIGKMEAEMAKLGAQNIVERLKKGLASTQEGQPIESQNGQSTSDERQSQYQQALSEIKLYQKLIRDYETKIELLSREKDETASKGNTVRGRLAELEYQIQTAEAELAGLKVQVQPKHLQPKLAKSMILEEKHRYESESLLRKGNKVKPNMSHKLPFAEVGSVSLSGKRFNDRNCVGKVSCRIVGITFHESAQTPHRLLGFQAIYQSEGTQQKGKLNLMSQVECKLTSPTLQEGDYVISVDSVQNAKGEVTGVVLLTKKRMLVIGGVVDGGVRIQLKSEGGKTPSCLFGSVTKEGLELFGVELEPEEETN